MKPKISVIVPVYNCDKYLEKCLLSILQEEVNKEIIVINDGSTDNSLNIIKDLMKKHNEILLINIDNHGQGYARNLGIKKCKGDYICFIDSDDFINKGSLETAISIVSKNKLDILFWNIDWLYNNGDIKHQNIFNPAYKKNDNIGYLLSDPSPCNKLIKSSLIKKNKLSFPTDCIYEDFAFIPSLVKYAKKIDYTDKIIYNYYQRKNSTMNQVKYNKKIMDIIVAYDHLYNSLYPDYKKELEYISIMQILYFKTLELLKFNKKEEINTCINYVNDKFPNWYTNNYYLTRNIIIRFYCKSIFKKKYMLCKILSYVRKIIRK